MRRAAYGVTGTIDDGRVAYRREGRPLIAALVLGLHGRIADDHAEDGRG
jgi:hypothetical protein